MGRGELTDAAWERITPLLPGVDGRGRPWRDHRQVINGVLWRLRTEAPWRDLPERYGPWQTVYERFARWEADGTWARLLEQVQVRDDSVGAVVQHGCQMSGPAPDVRCPRVARRAHQFGEGADHGPGERLCLQPVCEQRCVQLDDTVVGRPGVVLMICHGQDSIAGLIVDLVAGRGELTDAAWGRIEPLLPQVDGRGRPWRDHRQVVNGVLGRLRTGAPWRDLPERYGPWQTV
uniref:Putative transposase n=1 Tax=Streptomyces griseus TaxID=1911 RepID=C7G1U5_STRGR|nr:putative transposase [Streptomyces griseus]